MMKVIFLDIDGVLNSVRYDRERTPEQGNVDETRLPLLKRIVDTAQAQIVLSSSWRKHWDRDPDKRDDTGRALDGLFSRYGLSLYDKTPVLPGNDRAEEVRRWLALNGSPQAFVILDDCAFGWGDDLQAHLVKTDCRIGRGLEESHVRKAIDVLSGFCQKLF